MLLADYLANKTPGDKTPQTIVTTHSPTLAAAVPPSRIHVLFAGADPDGTTCNSLACVAMDEREEAELQRMMDITRATLYFAKAAIIVEGVCEALLVPALAERLGHDLRLLHISVIPICGVAFPTLKKLLDPAALGIPIAIVSDGDPHIVRGATWESDTPERGEDGEIKVGARIRNLKSIFWGHANVKVFHSKLTLEYDLAEAGDGNAAVMAREWSSCFSGAPGTFSDGRVINAGANLGDKALATWRGICRAEHSGSKAELAHRIATRLAERNDDGEFAIEFSIPTYLRQAIEHVAASVPTPAAPADAQEDEDSD
jgi:putative ATP-dependent endonuclease of OLD family